MEVKEIHSELEHKGFKVEEDIKIPSLQVPKYNGVFSKEGKNYFVKAFSGFKRKYLRREKLVRERLENFRGKSIMPHDYIERLQFDILILPFIYSKGNLDGREQNFSEQIFNIRGDLHSLSLSTLEGIKPYKPIQRMFDLKENLPRSTNLLSQINKLDFVQELSLSLIPRLSSKKMVFSHNDFNGDNMLLSLEDQVLLTDYEGCTPNFSYEDTSALLFYNILKTGQDLKSSPLYIEAQEPLSIEDRELLDFFILYRSFRTYDYFDESKQGLFKGIKKGDLEDITISLINKSK